MSDRDADGSHVGSQSNTGVADTLVRVGHIAGAHGVRGEVLIKSYTGVAEDIASYGALTDQHGKSLKISRCRVSSKGVVAVIAGVTNRKAADELRGTVLHLDRSQFPEPDADEWYIADLIGLTVEDESGANIGSVVTAHDFGAGELLELALDDRAQTVLVPFTLAVVPEVRIGAGTITVALTPDLLGETEDDDARHDPSSDETPQ